MNRLLDALKDIDVLPSSTALFRGGVKGAGAVLELVRLALEEDREAALEVLLDEDLDTIERGYRLARIVTRQYEDEN